MIVKRHKEQFFLCFINQGILQGSNKKVDFLFSLTFKNHQTFDHQQPIGVHKYIIKLNFTIRT